MIRELLVRFKFLVAITSILLQNTPANYKPHPALEFSTPMTQKSVRLKPYEKPDELRSRIMRSNKSYGNFSTEITLLRLLRSTGISGWRRKVVITGRPDFVFKHNRVAVFIDGCYWHGCKCRRLPKKNQLYWLEKFQANQKRDRRVTRELRKNGWNVIRIREHQLKKNPGGVIKRIAKFVGGETVKERIE